ncbi:hypothetical protein Fmac_018441 [Flemingia macrophylla]|uniref:Uncharacterized protein n=1 Tax=Flemingia macrophylla TaxID=520843 RepID=A0ABD1M6Z5_9FABA
MMRKMLLRKSVLASQKKSQKDDSSTINDPPSNKDKGKGKLVSSKKPPPKARTSSFMQDARKDAIRYSFGNEDFESTQIVLPSPTQEKVDSFFIGSSNHDDKGFSSLQFLGTSQVIPQQDHIDAQSPPLYVQVYVDPDQARNDVVRLENLTSCPYMDSSSSIPLHTKAHHQSISFNISSFFLNGKDQDEDDKIFVVLSMPPSRSTGEKDLKTTRDFEEMLRVFREKAYVPYLLASLEDPIFKVEMEAAANDLDTFLNLPVDVVTELEDVLTLLAQAYTIFSKISADKKNLTNLETSTEADKARLIQL